MPRGRATCADALTDCANSGPTIDLGAFVDRLLRGDLRALRRAGVVLDQELDVGLLNSAIAISAAFFIETAATPALPGADSGRITATRTAPAGPTGAPGCTGVTGAPTAGGSARGDVEDTEILERGAAASGQAAGKRQYESATHEHAPHGHSQLRRDARHLSSGEENPRPRGSAINYSQRKVK